MQFEVFQSENKQEIQSLFDKMKNEFESQKEEKEQFWTEKINQSKSALDKSKEQLREKQIAVKALELRISEI